MTNISDHIEIIKLIIAYTLAGAFVCTVVITLLSLPGWIVFRDQKQQQKLFAALALQLVVGCVGVFSDLLKYDAKSVQENIQRPLRSKLEVVSFENQNLQRESASDKTQIAALSRERATAMLKAEELAAAVHASKQELIESMAQLAAFRKKFNDCASPAAADEYRLQIQVLEARLKAMNGALRIEETRPVPTAGHGAGRTTPPTEQ